MLHSIFFDIDDTIYDQMEPFSAACRKFKTLETVNFPDLYQARSVRGMEALKKMADGVFTLQENHIYRMVMACRDLGITFSETDAIAFQEEYARQQELLRPTAGMYAVLDFCVDHQFFLGIITNGPSAHQRKKFDILGLDRWISPDHIITSGDCGWLKPDVRIFKLAEQTWKFLPRETLYVGDSYEHDMVGAQKAGWQTFWLNRRKRATPEHHELSVMEGNEEALLSFLKISRKPVA